MTESGNAVKTVCAKSELKPETGKHTHTIKETLEKPLGCVKACGHILRVLGKCSLKIQKIKSCPALSTNKHFHLESNLPNNHHKEFNYTKYCYFNLTYTISVFHSFSLSTSPPEEKRIWRCRYINMS